MPMNKMMTLKAYVDAIFALEARRLAFERAAELLYEQCAATDLGPPREALKATLWFESTVPESAVFAVVQELQARARELGGERARLERARVTVALADTAVATIEDSNPVITRLAG